MTSTICVRRGILTFLLLTFALSTIGWILVIATDEVQISLLYAPGIAALVTRFLYQRNFRDLGWGWEGSRGTRLALLAYAMPLAIAVVIYGATWLIVPDAWSSDDGTAANLTSFVVAASAGVLFNCIFAFGEELGWRGFLVPELAKLTSFRNVVLISGLIWAVWHYPLIFFAADLFEFSETPLWFAVPSFTLIIVIVSVVFAWLRLMSGSVWPAVILHASHNNFSLGFFADRTSESGTAPYIVTEVGVGLLVAWMIIAYVFWRKRSALPVASVH